MSSELTETGFEQRRGRWLTLLGLLAVLLAAHGASLWDGLFLDDHWQRLASHERGWGFHDLVESATIDFSGRWNRLWWQEVPLVWRYARPVGMLAVKIEYLLGGGDARVVHAFGLAWHGLLGWLVYRLALWAGLKGPWAFLAAAMFIMHPHSTAAMGWNSARNAVVNAVLLAAAVLTYARLSAPGCPRPGTVPKGGPPPLEVGERLSPADSARSRLWFALPVILWLLALLSRETAIIFPAIILVLDWSVGGRRHVRLRLPVHAVVWLLSGAFLYWRLVIFSVEAVPEVYFSRPEGPGDVLWAAGKLLYLVFSLIFYTPMIMGVSTLRELSIESILIHLLMIVLVGGVMVWYVWASRGVCGRWVWPIWSAVAFVPVIPVFAAPHFAYLPAVPYAIMLAVLMRSVGRRWRGVVIGLILAATVWSLGVYRFAMRGAFRAEQLVYADMVDQGGAPRPGTCVFFINLPLANIYAPVVLREAWHAADLEGYTLTLATHPLMMDHPSVVRAINDHEIEIFAPADSYFSGLATAMFMHVMRPGGALTEGMVIAGPEFDTTIVQADGEGLRRLKFTFRRPLASEEYIFYVSTPQRPAYRLRFDPPAVAMPPEDAGLFAQARSSDPQTRLAARRAIRERVQPVAVMTAAPVQADLVNPNLASQAALARIEEWWQSVDGPGLVRANERWQEDHAATLRERQYLFGIMDVVARIIHSDLFLTGERRGGMAAWPAETKPASREED